MSNRVSVIRDPNVTQSFCHPWSKCQAEFLSSVIGMSPEFLSSVIGMSCGVFIIRDRNVTQSFYHPWSECQAVSIIRDLSSVIGMSRRVSIIRDRNVKQSFYHPWSEYQAEFLSCVNRKSTRTFTRLQKKTDTCRNFPVTVVLEYFKRHNHKNHRDAQISITISSLHPSSLKF